jgi:hypothetical protein
VVEKRNWAKGYYSVVANPPTLWTNYVQFSFYCLTQLPSVGVRHRRTS